MELNPETRSVVADIWRRVSEEHGAKMAAEQAERTARYEAELAVIALRAPYVELYHEVDDRYGFYEGEDDVVRVESVDDEVLVTLDNTDVVRVPWDCVREHNLT